jgi:hypothetical protein
MSIFSDLANLFGGHQDDDESPTVYNQPLVEHDIEYDDDATPDETEQELMLDYALGGDADCRIENELYDAGWVNGRNGWVKYS